MNLINLFSDASFSRSRESAHPSTSGAQFDPLCDGTLQSFATRDFGEESPISTNVQQPKSHQQPMSGKLLLFFNVFIYITCAYGNVYICHCALS